MIRDDASMLPSELTVNENAWAQYREWLLERSQKKIAVVLGRAGIGKETMVRVVNKMLNYLPRVVDGTERREEVVQAAEELLRLRRARNMFGRKLVGVFRDIDPALIFKLAGRRDSEVPLVVILEDAPRKLFDAERVEVIRCYSDSHKVLQRVEEIARRRGVAVPRELRERVWQGEKIGKALADLQLHRLGARVPGVLQAENARTGHLEVIRKILHSRGGPRRKYQEIKNLCARTGIETVAELLQENYAEKCLTLEDLCAIAESVSSYEPCSRSPALYHLQEIPVYLQHTLLYNDLTASFKVPARTKTKHPRGLLYGQVPCRRWNTLPQVRALANALAVKIKQAAAPSRVDNYLKERIRALAAQLDLPELLEEEHLKLFKAIDLEPIGGAQRVPRYVHKDGYSCYVTRDISLSEIVQGQ